MRALDNERREDSNINRRMGGREERNESERQWDQVNNQHQHKSHHRLFCFFFSCFSSLVLSSALRLHKHLLPGAEIVERSPPTPFLSWHFTRCRSCWMCSHRHKKHMWFEIYDLKTDICVMWYLSSSGSFTKTCLDLRNITCTYCFVFFLSLFKWTVSHKFLLPVVLFTHNTSQFSLATVL